MRIKTVLPIEKLGKSQKYCFFGQNFFWVHFLQSINRQIFLYPIQIIQIKKFLFHRRVNVYFLWTKKSKMQYFVKNML